MGPPVSLREEGEFIVRVDEGEDAVLVRASGELDLAGTGILREELSRAWETNASVIVLDLGGLDFIDASGLQVLLGAAKRSREDGDRLSVWLGSGTAVSRLVELTGVEAELPLTDASGGLAAGSRV
jgi:anti-sigma B factor antagonist